MSDDFFGDLGKSITRATQRAIGKTGSLIETTKISAEITAESKVLEKLYQSLGEMAYDRIKSGDIPNWDAAIPLIDEIGVHRQKQAEFRKELADVKNMQICPSCGEAFDSSALFCPHCGCPVASKAVRKEESKS